MTRAPCAAASRTSRSAVAMLSSKSSVIAICRRGDREARSCHDANGFRRADEPAARARQGSSGPGRRRGHSVGQRVGRQPQRFLGGRGARWPDRGRRRPRRRRARRAGPAFRRGCRTGPATRPPPGRRDRPPTRAARAQLSVTATTQAPRSDASCRVSTTQRSYRRMSIATIVGGAPASASRRDTSTGIAVEQRHAGPQLRQLDHELQCHAARGRTGQDQHVRPLVGEAIDDHPGGGRVDVGQGDRDVRLLDRRVVAHVVEPLALLPDPLGGRPELAAQVTADRASAARRTRRSRACWRTAPRSPRRPRLRPPGRPRCRTRRPGVNRARPRDAAFGRSELAAVCSNGFRDAHRPDTVVVIGVLGRG